MSPLKRAPATRRLPGAIRPAPTSSCSARTRTISATPGFPSPCYSLLVAGCWLPASPSCSPGGARTCSARRNARGVFCKARRGAQARARVEEDSSTPRGLSGPRQRHFTIPTHAGNGRPTCRACTPSETDSPSPQRGAAHGGRWPASRPARRSGRDPGQSRHYPSRVFSKE